MSRSPSCGTPARCWPPRCGASSTTRRPTARSWAPRSTAASATRASLAGSGRGGETVASAAHRLQGSGAVAQLAAQGADHDLDDVAAAAPVVAPDVAQQRRPADDPALAFAKVLQDVEFQLGEVGPRASEYELAAVGVEQGVVVNEHFPRGQVGQPAVDGGRPEVVVEGLERGPSDLGGAFRETGEAERRELGQRGGGI